MPTFRPPRHFHINTDLRAYKRHHKKSSVDNPIHYWLEEGYAYLTPTLVSCEPVLERAVQDKRKGYRDYLRAMEKGSVVFAYESVTGAGYVAAGTVQEVWDEQARSGRAELFMDEHEIYYRIAVRWDDSFTCALKELRKAGFAARPAAVAEIKDERLIDFLSNRRRNQSS